jgi:hypothetical protein
MRKPVALLSAVAKQHTATATSKDQSSVLSPAGPPPATNTSISNPDIIFEQSAYLRPATRSCLRLSRTRIGWTIAPRDRWRLERLRGRAGKSLDCGHDKGGPCVVRHVTDTFE